MIYALNIVLIAMVAMIAYWWANQGLFSAIIHLLCVIVAGAIALAFWEPVTVGLLLRGNAFDNYAWGVSLVGLFVAVLLLLRLATNKLIPALSKAVNGDSSIEEVIRVTAPAQSGAETARRPKPDPAPTT